jgi:steroid delta-isomerase-like uncharacterized protein
MMDLSKGTRMSEANKALVRRLFEECLNQHNLDLYSFFYSDVVYRASSVGILRGEEHLHLLSSLLAGFPDAHWSVEDQIAEADRVVTRWMLLATHTGTFMGVNGTGQRLRCAGISVDRIVSGKIVEEWEEWDTLGFMQQLGAIPMEARIADLVAP